MGFLTWLAAKFSRQRALAPLPTADLPPLYGQHNRIGGGLTPEDVSRILREADTGRLSPLVDLGNDSRQKDGHLHSCLGTREIGVAGLSWRLTPATKDAEDRFIADWCTEWLTNFGTSVDDPDNEIVDLTHLLSHMQGGRYFGYAYAETMFGRDGKYVIPTGAIPIHPRRFIICQQTSRFLFYDELGGQPGLHLASTYPGRIISFHPRVNGDYATREGLLRLLIWPALFRNWTVSDWLKLAEIAWKPWRIGTYASGRGRLGGSGPATAEDIAALRRGTSTLTANGSATLPDTVELTIATAKRGGGQSEHLELCEFNGREMSKATLGQTMTTEDGSSYAQAKVHNYVREDIRRADALEDASGLRRDLIAPAVRLNFGDGAKIPKIALFNEEQADILLLARAVANFTRSGLRMPSKWVRETAGIAEPVDGDEVIGEQLSQLSIGGEAHEHGTPDESTDTSNEAA